MNKTPNMIVVTTLDRFFYVVEWDYMPDFQNEETGDWDCIPTTFLGFRYNTTTQTIADDTTTVLGVDVDKIVAIL
jgi:hypothetical protein